MNKIKVIFFGTPEIAVPTLEALCNDDAFEVGAVVTKPDMPVGRKQILTAPAIKLAASRLALPVYQPHSLKNDHELFAKISGMNPDVFVVFAYGEIMTDEWLSLPRVAPFNIHASLLPKYRGASPINETLLHGDTKTGIAIQKMVKKLDAGPIASMTEIDIEPNETAITLAQKIAEMSPTLTIETVKKAANDSLTYLDQNETSATHCSKITKADGFVNAHTMTAHEIHNRFRAYQPWPGIWTFSENGTLFSTQGTRVKILSMEMGNESDTKCKQGYIRIHTVQPEGKTPVDFQTYLRSQTTNS